MMAEVMPETLLLRDTSSLDPTTTLQSVDVTLLLEEAKTRKTNRISDITVLLSDLMLALERRRLLDRC